MKFLKWFSLFFMSVSIAFVGGLLLGFRLESYFYPQEDMKNKYMQVKAQKEPVIIVEEQEERTPVTPEMVEVSGTGERIDADTTYILVERNMDTDEKIENVGKLPEMYLGMNREQFVASMADYEASPPLSELERGFVSLEVQRFSQEEVKVLMNYSYVKPGKCFYVVVYNDLVTVLLEDRKTVYLQTGMRALDLPESMQQELLQGMFIPDEESLYDFLENYTS